MITENGASLWVRHTRRDGVKPLRISSWTGARIRRYALLAICLLWGIIIYAAIVLL